MNITESQAFAILAAIPGLDAKKVRTLLINFGSAVESLRASVCSISALAGFERVIPHWQSWKQKKDWELDLKEVHQENIQLIPFTDPQYPKPLLELSDHPIVLYVKGTITQQDKQSIAVVGTRNATIYGNEMSQTISKDLASLRFTVVSGLARGIDTSAHIGALQKGRTIAVIGSGLKNIYPPENKRLSHEIAENGALISEYPMLTPPHKYNFPKRNRIVSGMTLGTLLIEAPIDSGAMITMKNALQQKRKLFALPGRADSENFRGNHLLIKNNQAHLIENATDIISHYEDMFPFPAQLQQNTIPHLNDEEMRFLKKIPDEELNIDSISGICALPAQHVSRLLMGLVIKRAMKEFPGKIYKKIRL